MTVTATKMAMVMAKRVAGERRRRRRRDGGGRRRERWRWRRGWRASDSNEGEGDSNEGDGDGDWGGVRQRGEGEGDAEGDESGSRRRGRGQQGNGDSDKGGGRAMAMATRVVGEEEGEVGKGDGKETATRRRGPVVVLRVPGSVGLLQIASEVGDARRRGQGCGRSRLRGRKEVSRGVVAWSSTSSYPGRPPQGWSDEARSTTRAERHADACRRVAFWGLGYGGGGCDDASLSPANA